MPTKKIEAKYTVTIHFKEGQRPSSSGPHGEFMKFIVAEDIEEDHLALFFRMGKEDAGVITLNGRDGKKTIVPFTSIAMVEAIPMKLYGR